MAFAIKQGNEADRRIGRKAGGIDQCIEHRIRVGRHTGQFSQTFEASRFARQGVFGPERFRGNHMTVNTLKHMALLL
ncbi:hypothetical protein J2Z19_005241 [Ensifer adhaerens]|uniref:Uncharacterized protein n=1 Tax=Ensifer adhaerens TaxID=106592 RepID=A0ACC5T307_ENSAD|nr:hypothetical protein [Ensifer adhaerens]MBP1875505.1 hypothetical protein [Ensifer adhaerens]